MIKNNRSKNFWKDYKKPIYALAPMAGITDSAFRQMCKKYGADVVYSEMASVNALCYSPEKTLEMLRFKEIERPYVVQLFGNEPKFFANAAKIIEKEIKPDGIDINFGCPVPKVAKQKAGAELGKDLKQSRTVIESVLSVATLPVSIKIRKKVGDVDALSFLDNVKDLDISAVMIHGRSLSQMHAGPVDVDIIKQAREHFKGIILANGGVKDRETSCHLLEKTGADGIGIAQGSLGCPWIFDVVKKTDSETKTQEEIFSIILEHTKLVFASKGKKGVLEMRKHLCWYVQGFLGAKRLRDEFVKIESISEIEEIIKNATM